MDSCLFPKMQIFPLKTSITQSQTNALHTGVTNKDAYPTVFNTDTQYTHT